MCFVVFSDQGILGFLRISYETYDLEAVPQASGSTASDDVFDTEFSQQAAEIKVWQKLNQISLIY